MSSGNSPLSISFTKQITKQTPEIFMREKERKLRLSVSIPTNLLSSPILLSALSCFCHTVFLVQEPPGRTPLYFACCWTIIEVANHRGKEFIVGRVQVINNCFGQCVITIQPVHEQPVLLPVKKSPILSHPVSGPSCFIIRLLLFRKAPRWYCCTNPFPNPILQKWPAWQIWICGFLPGRGCRLNVSWQNAGYLRGCVIFSINFFQPVVAYIAVAGYKIIVAFFQRSQVIIESADRNIGCLFQCGEIVIKIVITSSTFMALSGLNAGFTFTFQPSALIFMIFQGCQPGHLSCR